MARLSDSITYGNHTITGDVNVGGSLFAEGVKFEPVSLSAGSNVSISGSYPNFTISSTDTNTTYSAGSGINLSGTSFSLDINGTFSGEYPIPVTTNGTLYVNPNITFNGSTGTLTAPKFSGDGSGLTNLPTSGVPSGAIVMWSGSIASIPSGWVLCDGANGTPNLQDRFVVGAGNSYAVGATGGSKDAVVVSHSHNGIADFSGGHSHTINSNGSHRHIEGAAQGSAYTSGYYPYGRITSSTRSGFTWGNYDSTSYEIYTDYSGTHSHTMASAPNHQHLLNIDPSGESGVDKNLPPYYALAFIMKT